MAQTLFNRWKRLCRELNIIDSDVMKHWDVIEAHYTENHRHYHTLEHLREMFSYLDLHAEDFIECGPVVALAIFFHDVVYDPRAESGYNEDESANVFLRFAKEVNLSDPISTTVSTYIDRTKSHSLKADEKTSAHLDLHLFLDLDMAVLGRSLDGYMTYASQIRQEYTHINVHDYCRGRSTVLSNFLAEGPIYHSTLFRSLLEDRARSNIATEIAMLENGDIPAYPSMSS